jgi:PKHD-type hydroxylase
MAATLSLDDDIAGDLIHPKLESLEVTHAHVRQTLRMNGHVSCPLMFTGIFSSDECDRIADIASRQRMRTGRMMYGRPNVRKSRIAWLGVQAQTEWLYDKIWKTFCAVNRWYEFELLGLVDEVQYATYEVGDNFDWHLDTGGGQTSTRKISMSVQLSDERDYVGGDLEFSACSLVTPRRRGTVIAFPSFLSHRITQVTDGVRTSLVAWAHGPVFK